MKRGRFLVLAVFVLSLLSLNVLATDEVVENDNSSVEGQEDPVQGCACNIDLTSVTTDLSTIIQNQEQIKDNQDDEKDNQGVINDNLQFLTACVVSCAGIFIGYWSIRDILRGLWSA